MAQVSVFEGGFTLEAAEAVIDLSIHDKHLITLDVLQSLVDRSWLRVKVMLGAPRFEMFATVQEYASAKLSTNATETTSRVERADVHGQSSDSVTNVENRYSTCFARMGTDQYIEGIYSHAGLVRLDQLRTEIGNLTKSLRIAITNHREEDTVGAYVAAARVLRFTGPIQLGLKLGHDAISVAKTRSCRGRILRELAHAEHVSGHLDKAMNCLEEALGHFRRESNRRSQGRVHYSLGMIHVDLGQSALAKRHLHQALAIHREVHDLRMEGMTLAKLGDVCFYEGRLEEALAQKDAALAIHRRVGDRPSEGRTLGATGLVYQALGRTTAALQRYESALSVQRAVGDLSSVAHILGNLSGLHDLEGRRAMAIDYVKQSMATFQEIGHRQGEGICMSNLALMLDKDTPDEARAKHEAALSILKEVSDRRSEAHVLDNLGDHYQRQGWLEEARSYYHRAIDIFGEFSAWPEVARVNCSLGELELKKGAVHAARAALAKARSMVMQHGLTPDSELERKMAELRKGITEAAN